MSDSAEHRQSSASATRPQVEQLLGLRRDGTSGGAEGGGAEGGVGGGGAEGGVGGGVPEDCDGGEDTGVIRLWRKAFSGLKLAKEKSSKKKKRSSIDESEDIDPVYSLLKLAADRGTQKCAACCTQSDKLSPAAARCQCPCHSQHAISGSAQPPQPQCSDRNCSGSGVWAARGRIASTVCSHSSDGGGGGGSRNMKGVGSSSARDH